MQMEQIGTQEAEKEFITTTHQEHGLSYKLCNLDHPRTVDKVDQCAGFIEQAVFKSGITIVTASDLVQKIKSKKSDLWLSVDNTGKIVGCMVVGVASYPSDTGVFVEALAGEFEFQDICKAAEEFYKDRGFAFVEIQGRKGWEKVLSGIGYQFSNITLIKRLR